MSVYTWTPITQISDQDREIDLANMQSIYEIWRTSRERIRELSERNLNEFNKRLVRRLSIETGILERLYDLDRGTTEALVAQGFVEDLVSRSSTNIEPSRLIDILRDQESAIQLVMDCVSKNRPLTKGILHELHSILVKHEDTTTAVDQFGQRREIPLLKGKFKEHPNNPRRPDGNTHEYCPPIHVESEIENLLNWSNNYHNDDPILAATWLHHRFTQIHPYQDGNGRVARSLTTLVLLRAGLLPLVIDRDLRVEYISALEAADKSDLSKLTLLFARLERTAILQALSVDADSEISYQKTLTSAVIESLAQKFERRRQEKYKELRKVNKVASSLRIIARKAIEKEVNKLHDPLKELGNLIINISDGGPDRNNAHWYKYEVIQSAEDAGKFANFYEEHYFLKSALRINNERLVFITSFHHVGRELSGIMEATCFAILESREGTEDGEQQGGKFFVCSIEPFVFTYKTSANDIEDKFVRWLDQSLAVAIKEYGDRL